MDLTQAIVLALIQGITEFLPISSSAHLILPAALTDWPDQGLAFDVAVHLGSLVAVLAFFAGELSRFATGGWHLVTGKGYNEDVDLLLKIALATVPVAIAGLVFKEFIESELRSVAVIAVTTIGFGLLLGVADLRRGETSVLAWGHALAIGAAQILALIPGTSRSGITMTAALLLGLTRTMAARVSFLLAIPTIAGAAALLSFDLTGEGAAGASWLALATGFVVAGGSAYLVMQAFMRLIERTGMLPYVIYRLVLGTALLMALA